MEHFLAVYSARYGKRITGFEEDAVAAMLGYAWPGNIRELENVVERGVIMGRDDEPLRLYHLFSGGERLEAASYRLRPDGRVSAPEKEEMPALTMPEAALQSDLTLAEMEERLVQQALRQTNGNKTKAAALLGLSRTQLHYRLRQRS
jgi:DNA-binding NtrC family response regulator